MPREAMSCPFVPETALLSFLRLVLRLGDVKAALAQTELAPVSNSSEDCESLTTLLHKPLEAIAAGMTKR